MFTKEKILKYADDLLIKLNDEEVNDLLKEFDEIDKSMNMINNIDGLAHVKPLSFPQDIKTTVLRDDNDTTNISTSDALKNSSNAFEDVIEVPKVVG